MNLIAIGVFCIILLAILGLVSNTSETGLNAITSQMVLSQCPLPTYDATATIDPVHPYIGFQLNYTLTYGTGGSNATGSYFKCYIDLTSNPEYQINIQDKDYGATLFGFIPYGWLGYIADFLTTLWQRAVAVLTMIGYVVSPTGFNIFGYTISDLVGLVLMLVVLVYIICYIFIGILVYKIISPFAGLG